MSVGPIRRRLAAAVSAGRAASALAGAAPGPAPRPAPGPPGRPACWALVHLGPDPAFPAALEGLVALCAGRALRPLVLSDRFPQQLLGRPAIVFEHLPLAMAPACGTGDAELVTDYACRRLALALDFWGAAGVTWSGPAAEALREACAGRLPLGPP